MRPLADAVIVTVWQHSQPQTGNFVIPQADVVAGAGPARKASADQGRPIAAIPIANTPGGFDAVGSRGIGIAPPLQLAAFLDRVDEWQADPDESCPAR